MTSVRRVISCFLLPLVLFGVAALAVEKDKAGTRDHPLVSRCQGSVLHNQGSSGFEQVELPRARYDTAQQPAKPVKSQRVEGKVLNYAYFPPRFLVAQLKGPQGDVNVSLTVRPPSSVQDGKGVGPPYFLQVVEVQALRTDAGTVNAAALQKGLGADGKVALHGVFSTPAARSSNCG